MEYINQICVIHKTTQLIITLVFWWTRLLSIECFIQYTIEISCKYIFTIFFSIWFKICKKFFLSVRLFGVYRLISWIGTSIHFIVAEVYLPLLSTLCDNVVNSTFSLNKMITPLYRCVTWFHTYLPFQSWNYSSSSSSMFAQCVSWRNTISKRLLFNQWNILWRLFVFLSPFTFIKAMTTMKKKC